MTLSELIKKNIKENWDYWEVEPYVWLIPKFHSETGEICFRYGEWNLRATEQFEAINIDDEEWPFFADQETLNEASNYLFTLKLEEELTTLLKDKRKSIKI